MTAFDTNILLHAHHAGSPLNAAAREYLTGISAMDAVVMCELVLVELYVLLRNPAVVGKPLSSEAAVKIIAPYRRHPRWRLVESAEVMTRVWTLAQGPGFARRRIFDARLAFTLQHHGVTDFATLNVKDFDGLGFRRVWNPLADE